MIFAICYLLVAIPLVYMVVTCIIVAAAKHEESYYAFTEENTGFDRP